MPVAPIYEKAALKSGVDLDISNLVTMLCCCLLNLNWKGTFGVDVCFKPTRVAIVVVV